jgi:hypothetical protein
MNHHVTLDQQNDELDWRRGTFRAVRSVRSINVRTLAPAELPHIKKIPECALTPHWKARKEERKTPNINLQHQHSPTELRIHRSSFLIKFMPLLDTRSTHASRNLRWKKQQQPHHRQRVSPPSPQSGCCYEIHTRQTHPSPWRKP